MNDAEFIAHGGDPSMPEHLRAQAVPLSDDPHRLRGVAWQRPQALEVVGWFRSAGKAILGVDVYRRGGSDRELQRDVGGACDHYDPRPGEAWFAYAARTWRDAEAWINWMEERSPGWWYEMTASTEAEMNALHEREAAAEALARRQLSRPSARYRRLTLPLRLAWRDLKAWMWRARD